VAPGWILELHRHSCRPTEIPPKTHEVPSPLASLQNVASVSGWKDKASRRSRPLRRWRLPRHRAHRTTRSLWRKVRGVRVSGARARTRGVLLTRSQQTTRTVTTPRTTTTCQAVMRMMMSRSRSRTRHRTRHRSIGTFPAPLECNVPLHTRRIDRRSSHSDCPRHSHSSTNPLCFRPRRWVCRAAPRSRPPPRFPRSQPRCRTCNRRPTPAAAAA
jgi:hypothetical protein